MNYGQFFFDESIKIEHIIWLASQHDVQCEAFEEFLEDEDPRDIAKLLGLKIGDVRRELKIANECLLSLLAREDIDAGFLVLAATPVPRQFHEGGHSFSWGHVQTKWFYTKQLDDAFLGELKTWRESVVETQRQRLAAKQR